MLKEGDKAPDIKLDTDTGEPFRLSKLKGKKVVLYFYPRADTPGCTTETCEFRDMLPKFKSTKAVVLGASILDEKSKAKFAAKYNVNFPLLADADHAVAEKYGVWQEKMNYGKAYMGIVRTTYLIGPDGVVKQRWDKVKVEGHAEEVLKAD